LVEYQVDRILDGTQLIVPLVSVRPKEFQFVLVVIRITGG
jgi:hypothetical protein